ncbi:hypothetical protein D3C83_153440 [compost metagenome]
MAFLVTNPISSTIPISDMIENDCPSSAGIAPTIDNGSDNMIDSGSENDSYCEASKR